MKQQEAVDFLEGMRSKEFCLGDHRDLKLLAKARGYDVTDIPDGQLSEIVERKPHSLISLNLGSVVSIKSTGIHDGGLGLCILKLVSVSLQGEDVLIKCEARAYNMHSGKVDDSRLFEVELVMKEVTIAEENSALMCA